MDRDAIQIEMDDLAYELTRIAETTSFNDKIYPLASEGTKHISLPSELTSATLVMENDTGGDVICNGMTYKAGAKITLDDVLWINDSAYTKAWMGLHNQSGAGNVRPITNTQTKYSLKDLFQIAPSSETKILNYPTLDDVQADENGYLYISSNTVDISNDRRYIQSPGMGLVMIQDENGTLNGTPLPEKCEAANCLRVGPTKVTTADDIKIQSGALANQFIDIPLVDATAAKLGVENLDVMTYTYASKAITIINDAIAKVSEYRSTFGACQNRLEHAKANVDNTSYNTQDAESKIRDTDMSKEVVRNSTSSILSQVGQSVLSQESKRPQSVLDLLG